MPKGINTLWGELGQPEFMFFSLGFPYKIANSEAGGQREYPLGDQRKYSLVGSRQASFLVFSQTFLRKILHSETGGQRDYPLGELSEPIISFGMLYWTSASAKWKRTVPPNFPKPKIKKDLPDLPYAKIEEELFSQTSLKLKMKTNEFSKPCLDWIGLWQKMKGSSATKFPQTNNKMKNCLTRLSLDPTWRRSGLPSLA